MAYLDTIVRKGTEYEIRDTDTQNKITQITDNMRSTIQEITGNTSYTYVQNQSIAYTAPHIQKAETYWESVIVPCAEGDVFSVKGHGGASTRLWCFSDAEGNVLSMSDAGLHVYGTYITITAPQNAAYLSCNSRYPNEPGGLIRGEALKLTLRKLNTLANRDSFPLYQDVTEVSGLVQRDVTFTNHNGVATFVGTASADTAFNRFGGSAIMLPDFEVGKTYYIKLNKQGTGKVHLALSTANSNGSFLRYLFDTDEDTSFTIDSLDGVHGMILRYRLFSGETYNCSISYAISTNPSNSYLQSEISPIREKMSILIDKDAECIYPDVHYLSETTLNGVTYSVDNGIATFSGQATSTSAINRYGGSSTMLPGFEVGKTYYVKLNKKGTGKVNLALSTCDSSGNFKEYLFNTDIDTAFVIDSLDGVGGMILRYYIYVGETYDCSLSYVISTTPSNTYLQSELDEHLAYINDTLKKPDVDGTNGQVLVSDGNGGQSWEDAPSGKEINMLINKDSAFLYPDRTEVSGIVQRDVTFTNHNGVATFVGTASADTVFNRFGSSSTMLTDFEVGKTYYVKLNKQGTGKVHLALSTTNSNGSFLRYLFDTDEDTSFTIDSLDGVYGMILRYRVLSGEVCNCSLSYVISTTPGNAYLQSELDEHLAYINDTLKKPDVDGTVGQVLVSDGNGGQSWEDAPSREEIDMLINKDSTFLYPDRNEVSGIVQRDVTFTNHDGTATFTGTAAADTVFNRFGSSSTMLPDFEVGKTYYVKLNKQGTGKVHLALSTANSSGSFLRYLFDTDEDTSFAIDSLDGVHGMILRYRLFSGETYDCSISYVISTNPSNTYLQSEISPIREKMLMLVNKDAEYIYPDVHYSSVKTLNGVTYSIDNGIATFSGQATSTSAINRYGGSSTMLPDFEVGKTYYVKLNKQGTGRVNLAVSLCDTSGNFLRYLVDTDKDTSFTVDSLNGVGGMFVRYRIFSGETYNCSLSYIISTTPSVEFLRDEIQGVKDEMQTPDPVYLYPDTTDVSSTTRANGVTLSVTNGVATFNGTASAVGVLNRFGSSSTVLTDFKANTKYYVKLNQIGTGKIYLVLTTYNSSGSAIGEPLNACTDTFFTLGSLDNVHGMILRYRMQSGETYDCSVSYTISTTPPNNNVIPCKLRIMQYNCGMFNFGLKDPVGIPDADITTKLKNFKKFICDAQPDIASMQECITYIDRSENITTDSVFTPTMPNAYHNTIASGNRAIYSALPLNGVKEGWLIAESGTYYGPYMMSEFDVHGRKAILMCVGFTSNPGAEYVAIRERQLRTAISLVDGYDYAFIALDMNNAGTVQYDGSVNPGEDTITSDEEGESLLTIAKSLGYSFAMGAYYPWENTLEDTRLPNRFSSIDNIIYKDNGKTLYKGFKMYIDHDSNSNRLLASDHYPVYGDFVLLN